MKFKISKKILATVLAIAMVVTGFGINNTSKTTKAASLGSSGDYEVTAEEVSSSVCKINFNSKNYAAYAILHYKVNDGAQQNVTMSGSDKQFQYSINGLKKGDKLTCVFTYNKGNAQYDTSEMTYVTGSTSSTDANIQAPFGLVVNSPKDNTVSVTTVSGSRESAKTSLSVTVKGQKQQVTTAAPTTTTEKGVVYIYQDINYGGRVAALNEGRYNLAVLQAKGFRNDDLSSLKVASGYEAILYYDDNFQGESRRITSDTAWIGSDFNDRTSSIIVQKKTVETTTTVKATEKENTDTGIAKPFGLVVSNPSAGTIGVVWGRGDINSYNVYIDGKKVASKVGCAYYTYTGYSQGTHTVAITTVSGDKES